MKNLRAIETFVRCVDAGSISAAASSLGVTPQAASKHIQELEGWVGAPLLHRNTRGLALTAEGEVFFERCKQGLASIDEGVRLLRRSANPMAGTVRLAVTPASIAAALVAPLLAKLQQRFPGICMDVVAHNLVPDAIAPTIDVWLTGVIASRPPATARRVAAVRLVMCAAPAYLERHGRPRTVDDLRAHRWVVFRDTVDVTRPYALRLARTGGLGSKTLRVPVALSVNDGATALRAVLDGAGIGVFAPFRVLDEIRAGRLVVLDVARIDETLGLYVHVAPHTNLPGASRAVADYLFEAFARHPGFVPGACEAAA